CPVNSAVVRIVAGAGAGGQRTPPHHDRWPDDWAARGRAGPGGARQRAHPPPSARTHQRGGSATAISAVPVAAIDGGRAGTQRGSAVPRSLRPGPPGWRRGGGRGVAFWGSCPAVERVCGSGGSNHVTGDVHGGALGRYRRSLGPSGAARARSTT